MNYLLIPLSLENQTYEEDVIEYIKNSTKNISYRNRKNIGKTLVQQFTYHTRDNELADIQPCKDANKQLLGSFEETIYDYYGDKRPDKYRWQTLGLMQDHVDYNQMLLSLTEALKKSKDFIKKDTYEHSDIFYTSEFQAFSESIYERFCSTEIIEKDYFDKLQLHALAENFSRYSLMRNSHMYYERNSRYVIFLNLSCKNDEAGQKTRDLLYDEQSNLSDTHFNQFMYYFTYSKLRRDIFNDER